MSTIYTTKSDAEVRAAVKTIFGRQNARVTRNGEVHVRGVMPNSNRVGWYLLGFTGTTALDEKIWDYDGDLNTSLAA